MKKLLSILLTLCLLSGIMLIPVSASTDTVLATGGNGKVELLYYGGANTPAFVENMSETTDRFVDRASSKGFNFTNEFPEFLRGTTYLQSSHDDKSHANYLTNEKWMSVKLYESATIYYLTGSNIVSTLQEYLADWSATEMESGWMTGNTKTTAAGDSVYEFSKSASDAKQWKAHTGGDGNTRTLYVFKKEIKVTDGKPVTVDFMAPGSYSDGNGLGKSYSLAFQFHGNSHISIDEFNGNADSLTVVDNMNEYTKRFWASDLTDKYSCFDFSYDYPKILEGATYVTWDIASQSNETFLTAKQDWITVTIDKSASLYVLTQQQTSTGTYMPWLNTYANLGAEWVKDENDEVANWHVYSLGNNWIKGSVYLFKIDIPVKEGETKTITFDTAGVYGQSGGEDYAPVYSLAFQWSDAEVYDVTVNKGANGTVSRTGTIEALSGQKIPLTIKADKGYVIDSVTVGGVDQNISGTSAKITPVITADTTIDVSFAAIDMPETLTAYTGNIFVNANETFTVGEDEVTAPAGILFAQAGEAYGEMARTSYGMIFSKTVLDIADVELGMAGTQTAAAEGSDSTGKYGIRFYGNGIVNGNTYYAVPYAVYTDGTTTTTLYGSSVMTFTIPAE